MIQFACFILENMLRYESIMFIKAIKVSTQFYALNIYAKLVNKSTLVEVSTRTFTPKDLSLA